MRLLSAIVALAGGLIVTGSSCFQTTCVVSADCPVGLVCGLGGQCLDRQCGPILDDDQNIVPDGGLGSNCGPGEHCVEGRCQLRSTDYLCEAGPNLCGPARPDTGVSPPTDGGN